MTPNKSKMTVLVFQLEGNDQTLQDGIRTITGAIDGMVRPMRTLPTAVVNGGAKALSLEEAPSETRVEASEELAAETASGGSEPRRTIKPPRVLPELKVPAEDLKKFLEEHKVPDQDNSRYIAVAFFLREKLSIHAVTMDHIYTCYRLLGWNTPKDAAQPLRRLKNQGFFEKADEAGAYTLNHVGENAIQNMKAA